MTKDEITLNKLKLGEIIEDAVGKMWLVTLVYKNGNIDLACLNGDGVPIDTWGEFLSQWGGEFLPQGCLNGALNTTIEPVRVFSIKWDAWGDDGGGLNFSACFRPWKTLPAAQKKQTVTVELEVDLETGEVVAKSKGGE